MLPIAGFSSAAPAASNPFLAAIPGSSKSPAAGGFNALLQMLSGQSGDADTNAFDLSMSPGQPAAVNAKNPGTQKLADNPAQSISASAAAAQFPVFANPTSNNTANTPASIDSTNASDSNLVAVPAAPIQTVPLQATAPVKRSDPAPKKSDSASSSDANPNPAALVDFQAQPTQQPLTLLTMLGFGQNNTPPASTAAGNSVSESAASQPVPPMISKFASGPAGRNTTAQRTSLPYASSITPFVSQPVQTNDSSSPSPTSNASSASFPAIAQPGFKQSNNTAADSSNATDPVPADDSPRAQAPSGDLAFALRLNNASSLNVQSAAADATVHAISNGQNVAARPDAFSVANDVKPAAKAAAASGMTGPASVPFSNPYTESSATQVSGTKATTDAAPAPAVEIDPQPEYAAKSTVNNVHLQLTGDNNQRVDVRLADHNGELRVSVRTGDTNLAQSLQEHMPDLTSRLDVQRVHSEIWTPAVASAAKSDANSSSFSNANGGSANSAGYSDNSGRQGNSQRQNGNSNQPDWLDELEGFSASVPAARRTQTWLQ